jgi:hypothetical protein
MEFDEKSLAGVIFEEMFDAIVVYKRDNKYRTNSTSVGSMNELFGKPRYTRRPNKIFNNDFTSHAYEKADASTRPSFQYDYCASEAIAPSLVARIFEGLLKFFNNPVF